MDFKHKNHLVSNYSTLQKQIQEIRDTICEGRTVTRANASLTPLTKDMQDAVMVHLEEVGRLFEQLVKLFANAELDKMRVREPVSATKMWASIQLRQLQENVSDMHPETFEKKFGEIESEKRAYLADVIERILQELTEAQKLV